jgi:hypothetical protein
MSEITTKRNDASHTATANGHGDNPFEAAHPHIRDALRGLKFGLVSIVVQDGVVIQIERTDRRRLR